MFNKTQMHPEDVYPILRDIFIAKAKEYGVDITSNHCSEFLSDLYDQCYHCLSNNIPNEDEEEEVSRKHDCGCEYILCGGKCYCFR